MKIYDIRLDPEDAKYGLNNGIIGWNEAVHTTKATIIKILPTKMAAEAERIRRSLPSQRTDARCIRCGGSGYRNLDYWVIVPAKGKICFRCNGSGLDPKGEPVFFRRRTVDHIKARLNKPYLIDRWASQITADHPYYCVLSDIVALAIAKQYQSIPLLPH